MEVKVFCPCGSKYKFDVEPVNERMPWPVNCPTCGADGTTLANEVIAQTLAANPPPAPAPAPVPIAMAAPLPPIAVAPVPPPAPAAGGLRINTLAAAPPGTPPPIGAAPPPSGAPPRFTPAAGRPVARPKASKESMWAKVGGGAAGAIVIAGGAILYILRIVRLGHAISVAASGDPAAQLTADLKEVAEMNLMADNSVVLYVKHDDFHEVANECAAFWTEKQHRNYRIIAPEKQEGTGAEYSVYPAHNGYVLIMGGLEWKDPMFEATAQHLSQKYATMVFDEKDVGFTGAFVFGVYDSGTNVFHCRSVDALDGGDKTKCEHIEWAKEHGYKPNTHDNSYFDIVDANRLTKQFGMKFYDEKNEVPTNYVVVAAVGN